MLEASFEENNGIQAIFQEEVHEMRHPTLAVTHLNIGLLEVLHAGQLGLLNRGKDLLASHGLKVNGRHTTQLLAVDQLTAILILVHGTVAIEGNWD